MPAGVYSFDIFVREYDDVDDPERALLDETATAADGNEYGLLTDLHFGVFGVLSAQAVVGGVYERAVML
jgi:hypothetical protein